MDFISCMKKRKLLDRGDYIIISIDDEIYNPQMDKILQKGNAGKKNLIKFLWV